MATVFTGSNGSWIDNTGRLPPVTDEGTLYLFRSYLDCTICDASFVLICYILHRRLSDCGYSVWPSQSLESLSAYY